MDAVKFLKEFNRMCKTRDDCVGCPLEHHEYCKDKPLNHTDATFVSAVEVVQKWSEETPIKTRQSEFLKLFPNARVDIDHILIQCPQTFDTRIVCHIPNCYTCRQKYWTEEIK